MTGVFVKDSNGWFRVENPSVNVDGKWYTCKAIYVKVDDDWKVVWRRSAKVYYLPEIKQQTRGLQDVRTCAA